MPVSALDGLHLIKFCTFLSPFRMGLTNPGRALGRFSLLLISLILLTLSSIPLFSTNLFRLAFHLCFARWTQSFFSERRACVVFQNHKSSCFRVGRGVPQGSVLALYFPLYSLMIPRPLCLLPSAALFTLTIWPFGPPHPRSLLRWRPHKELCFDWSAGLSTGVFLSIRANVRPPSSQWIPTKLTSNPTFSYSAPASVSIQLQLFLGSPSTALIPSLSMYLR